MTQSNVAGLTARCELARGLIADKLLLEEVAQTHFENAYQDAQAIGYFSYKEQTPMPLLFANTPLEEAWHSGLNQATSYFKFRG